MKALLPLAVFVLFVTPAQAAPIVSLTWDSCTGPLNRCITAGTGEVGLYVSVLGQDTPHTGYFFHVDVNDPSPLAVADAWRFDAPGCEGSSLIQMNYGSLSKSCPTFEGALAQHNITSYQFDAVTGSCRITMGSGYQAGNFTTIDPAVRYMLGQVLFNFSFAVDGPGTPGSTCGNLERGVAVTLVDALWVDLSFNSHVFALGSTNLTANDPLADCHPVPARSVTWGSIRAHYR